jgi:serine/threonine protein phosphatase PrpC
MSLCIFVLISLHLCPILEVLSTFGVIPTPTILRVQLDPSLDQYLVLGSDGFWDNLSEEQIVDTIAESETTQQCADRLIDYVTELTQYNDDIDNATVIVVHLP